jgi:histidine ammonia-lyase
VLPAFLIKCGGLNSGFMLVQYTAAALAHPASVPTCFALYSRQW